MAQSLAELRSEISNCQKCRLCEQRLNVVFGTGAENHVFALRAFGRRGNDAERRGGSSGYIAKLYFPPGKKDYSAVEKRNFQNGLEIKIL